MLIQYYIINLACPIGTYKQDTNSTCVNTCASPYFISVLNNSCVSNC